jgi:integrating conjugative element protein (TIGR03749 family)
MNGRLRSRALFALLLAVGPEAGPAAPLPALPDLPDPMAGHIVPEPPVHLVWTKVPLAITLPVGRERLVTFPVPVRAGLPPELGSEVLRTQIVGDTVYWTALKPFGAQRVQIQAVESGNVYLVDLAASKDAAALPHLAVSLPETPTADSSVPAEAPGPVAAPPPPKAPDYATLIRLAAQQLYGPARLRRVPEGVHRAPVAGGTGRRLIRGGAIEATPLSAWRAGALYLTAVQLRNRTYDPIDLDPRRLRGRWLAAAFQHGRLAGWGDLRDTTAVYLISTQPYAEALNGG